MRERRRGDLAAPRVEHLVTVLRRLGAGLSHGYDRAGVTNIAAGLRTCAGRPAEAALLVLEAGLTG